MYEQLRLKNQLCFRLYTAARLITSAYHPYLSKIGITYPQYLVLMVLWEKDHQPVNDIAHQLLLETNTITPLLQRMEKAGLVDRKKGEEDSRQTIVSLTHAGKQMQEKAKDIPLCLGQDIACKNIGEEEYRALIPLLDQLIEALK